MNHISTAFCRVAGVVLLREDRAALLQLRDDKPGLRLAGNWVFPGGHCDPDESTENCARREFFEETAYTCDTLRPLVRFVDDTALPCQDLTFFWAPYDGIQIPSCLEGQALEFVRHDRLATIKAPTYLRKVWDLAIESATHFNQA